VYPSRVPTVKRRTAAPRGPPGPHSVGQRVTLEKGDGTELAPPVDRNELRTEQERASVHTEHLQNVSIGTVVGGWLVAIAVSSLLVLVFVASGLFEGDGGETLWTSMAVVIGFWAGGFFAGMRAMQAAILHGVAIGLMSIVVWFVLNALAALFFPDVGWEALTPGLTVGLLFAQIAAAVPGALMGYNLALRGKPSLEEHPPEPDGGRAR
jgi:hypothetical protein